MQGIQSAYERAGYGNVVCLSGWLAAKGRPQTVQAPGTFVTQRRHPTPAEVVSNARQQERWRADLRMEQLRTTIRSRWGLQ